MHQIFNNSVNAVCTSKYRPTVWLWWYNVVFWCDVCLLIVNVCFLQLGIFCFSYVGKVGALQTHFT